jgi:phosphoglycerate dehydrogenase-like enzyme
MPTLLILAREYQAYRSVVEAANLPSLKIVEEPNQECDIVFGEPTKIREMLPNLPNLKWVQAMWAGVEPLLDPSLRRDYILTNARGVFGGLMSEYVFTYLLAHERKIYHYRALQMQKKWKDTGPGRLKGKTIGLLGVGSIGAEVAKTAKFFGMNVRGYTRASKDSPDVDEYFHGDSLLQFAKELDYLVSILPSTKETQKIVSAELLNALPSHALFINAGRGSAVDEDALVEALTKKKIAGAILDVFEKEPLPEDHPFWETPNLTITFHTSAPSFAEDIGKVFVENYLLYHAGKPLKYQVDFERGY